MFLYTDRGQSKSKVCSYILIVVRARVTCVLIYSNIQNATLCSLPWTQVANFISKRTIFCSYVPATTLSTSNYRVDRLVDLVVKASASRAEDPGFESRFRRDFFPGRVIPVTQKLALQWLPCQAPGVIGSALGLVGPVSVYCDWVR